MADPLGATIGAINLVRSFVDLRDETKVLALKSELLGLLVEAQIAQAALVEDKRELAQRIRELEAWDREKERYRLREIAAGRFVYVLAPEAEGDEPIHWICAKCYEDGKKSILQSNGLPGVYGGDEEFRCFRCNLAVTIQHQGRPLPPQREYDPYAR